MTDFLSRFKIPTILGLSIIFLGLISGVYLVLKEQIFTSQAAPDLTPQNITLTNLTDKSVTISWQTNTPAVSFITFGQDNPAEQTVLDDRDTTAPKPHITHYVTLKNLLPQTGYQFKITSGKITSEAQSFETAKSSASQTGFTPIIGSILDNTNPVSDGIVYLSITGAYLQSSLVKEGNFLIPLSYIRKTDLSDMYSLTEDATAKITTVTEKGSASLVTKLTANTAPLPPIKLGQSLDLTTPKETPPPNYDLNNDGKINSADNAIILDNIGSLRETSKSPKNPKADLNKDGTVDQNDLDLISQKLRDLGSQ